MSCINLQTKTSAKKAKEDVAKAWPWNPMREGEIIQLVNKEQSFVYCSSSDGKVTVKTDKVVLVVPFSKVHAAHRFRIDKEYYHKCFSAFVNRRILYYKKEREKAAKQERHNSALELFKKSGGLQHSVIVEANNTVRKHLYRPDTAYIPFLEHESVKLYIARGGSGDLRVKIVSWVEAENVFGVRLRKRFSIFVDYFYETNDWVADSDTFILEDE